MWPQSHRSVPLALFTAASFLGPVISPVVGGFLSQYTSWRWYAPAARATGRLLIARYRNYWIVLIVSGLVYVCMFGFLPETYRTKLLQDKARHNGMSPPQQSFKEKYYVNLTRPWIMLFTEPILFLLSLYMV